MNIRPFEAITKDELNLMRYWIEVNASTDGECEISSSMETILSAWEDNKSAYLFNMFGGNLILSKDVKFEKSEEMLQEEIEDKLLNYYSTGDTPKEKEFYHQMYQLYTYGGPLYDYANVRELFYPENLSENYYPGEDVQIPTPDGKYINLNHGCKVMKAIGKIATAYNIPYFEEFRIAHSLILNQKVLKGRLCLSIHPMDYMTMSDNDCGWDSCMSWCQTGDYRAGTVEMMNSPAVVVAYLASEHDYEINDWNWSNKKWRELFVVNSDIITEVKPYPYQNESLTNKCLVWLKELAEKANIGTYLNNFVKFNESEEFYISELDRKCSILMLTNTMYNDFGTCGHRACINPNISSKYNFNYSGPLTCMVCGEKYEPSESYLLLCSDCGDYHRCSCCNEVIDGDVYYVGDDAYCEYCYNENFCTCELCENTVHNEEMTTIYLATDDEHIYTSISVDMCEHCVNESNLNIYEVEDNNHWWRTTYKYVLLDEWTNDMLSNAGFTDKEDVIKWLNDDNYMGKILSK